MRLGSNCIYLRQNETETFTYVEPGSFSKASTMLLMAISFFGPNVSNPVMLKKAIPDIKVLLQREENLLSSNSIDIGY